MNAVLHISALHTDNETFKFQFLEGTAFGL